MDIFGEIWQAAKNNLDILMVAGIIVSIEALKFFFPRLDKAVWFFVCIALGALAGWIATPIVSGHGKDFARAAVYYSGAAFIAFQLPKYLRRIRGRKG